MTLPNYVTAAQVKAYWVNNGVQNTSQYDNVITTLCTNCSRAFDVLTFHLPGAFAVTADAAQLFNGKPWTATAYQLSIAVPELATTPTLVEISISGSQTAFVPLASTDFYCEPLESPLVGKPFTTITLDAQNGQYKQWPIYPRSIRVTGKFGYSTTIPDAVNEALLLYVVRMIRKIQNNYLEVGQLLDSGQVMIGMKYDPDLQTLIQQYRKAAL